MSDLQSPSLIVILTAGEDHPDEVHEKVVDPEVQELRSAICDTLVVMVEHACGIVEDEPVNLPNANNDLQGMAKSMLSGDEGSDNKAQRPPGELYCGICQFRCFAHCRRGWARTAVTVSMHSTNGSEVRYRESEKAYSFHS